MSRESKTGFGKSRKKRLCISHLTGGFGHLTGDRELRGSFIKLTCQFSENSQFGKLVCTDPGIVL